MKLELSWNFSCFLGIERKTNGADFDIHLSERGHVAFYIRLESEWPQWNENYVLGNIFLKKTKPNEFGSMTARKGNKGHNATNNKATQGYKNTIQD